MVNDIPELPPYDILDDSRQDLHKAIELRRLVRSIRDTGQPYYSTYKYRIGKYQLN